jgi:hypothetical protein
MASATRISGLQALAAADQVRISRRPATAVSGRSTVAPARAASRRSRAAGRLAAEHPSSRAGRRSALVTCCTGAIIIADPGLLCHLLGVFRRHQAGRAFHSPTGLMAPWDLRLSAGLGAAIAPARMRWSSPPPVGEWQLRLHLR